jgi:hypothetical protein
MQERTLAPSKSIFLLSTLLFVAVFSAHCLPQAFSVYRYCLYNSCIFYSAVQAFVRKGHSGTRIPRVLYRGLSDSIFEIGRGWTQLLFQATSVRPTHSSGEVLQNLLNRMWTVLFSRNVYNSIKQQWDELSVGWCIKCKWSYLVLVRTNPICCTDWTLFAAFVSSLSLTGAFCINL